MSGYADDATDPDDSLLQYVYRLSLEEHEGRSNGRGSDEPALAQDRDAWQSFDDMPDHPALVSVLSEESLIGGTCSAEEEDRADREYARAQRDCLDSRGRFCDPDFPADDRSIGDITFDVTVRNVSTGVVRKERHPIVWYRPDEIVPDSSEDRGLPAQVIVGRSSGLDVAQGQLGDCWLVSAMAVAAESDMHIHNALRQARISPEGVYQIRLCLGGVWTVVTIDDRLPCSSALQQLAFVRGTKRQFWAPFVEKALAKVMGSYPNLVSGTTAEGLRYLTGAPVTSLSVKDGLTVEESLQRRAYESESRREAPELPMLARNPSLVGGDDGMDSSDALWLRLVSWLDVGFLLGASCAIPQDDNSAGLDPDVEAMMAESMREMGLVASHAYSLLEVLTYQGTRLVKLRNPWGSTVWRGKWGPSWSGWTEESRAALGAVGMEESGQFFLEFADFQRFFREVFVARTRTGWYQARRTLRWPADIVPCASVPVVRVQTLDPTETYLVASQANQRMRNTGFVQGIPPKFAEDDRWRMQGVERDLGIMVATWNREDAAVAVSALAEYRERVHGDPPPVGVSSMRCPAFLSSSRRRFHPWNNLDLHLPGGRNDILLLPLSFLRATAHTTEDRITMEVHSHAPVSVQEDHIPMESFVHLLFARAAAMSIPSMQGDHYRIWNVSTDDISMVLAENLHPSATLTVTFRADVSGTVTLSRGTGETEDVLPPLSRQVLQVMTRNANGMASYSSSFSISFRTSSSPEASYVMEHHDPPVERPGLHSVIPLSES